MRVLLWVAGDACRVLRQLARRRSRGAMGIRPGPPGDCKPHRHPAPGRARRPTGARTDRLTARRVAAPAPRREFRHTRTSRTTRPRTTRRAGASPTTCTTASTVTTRASAGFAPSRAARRSPAPRITPRRAGRLRLARRSYRRWSTPDASRTASPGTPFAQTSAHGVTGRGAGRSLGSAFPSPRDVPNMGLDSQALVRSGPEPCGNIVAAALRPGAAVRRRRRVVRSP